ASTTMSCKSPLVAPYGYEVLNGDVNFPTNREDDDYDIFATEEYAINWIIDNQLGRRNLTPDQASYLRGKGTIERRQRGMVPNLGEKISPRKQHPNAASRSTKLPLARSRMTAIMLLPSIRWPRTSGRRLSRRS